MRRRKYLGTFKNALSHTIFKHVCVGFQIQKLRKLKGNESI